MDISYVPGTFPEVGGKKLVDIVAIADAICPFCYLGYIKMAQAIQRAEDENLPLTIVVRFAPFQLDPTLDDEPISTVERMSRRFGAERFRQLSETMKGRFIEAGLPPPAPNVMIRQTSGSHRLVWKASQGVDPKLPSKVVGALYKSHFIDGNDVGDLEVHLSKVAVETGLFDTKEEAVKWLNGKEGFAEYEEGIQKAQRLGITGVPFWTINSKYAVSGAQDSETFYRVFKSISEGGFDARRGY